MPSTSHLPHPPRDINEFVGCLYSFLMESRIDMYNMANPRSRFHELLMIFFDELGVNVCNRNLTFCGDNRVFTINGVVDYAIRVGNDILPIKIIFDDGMIPCKQIPHSMWKSIYQLENLSETANQRMKGLVILVSNNTSLQAEQELQHGYTRNNIQIDGCNVVLHGNYVIRWHSLKASYKAIFLLV